MSEKLSRVVRAYVERVEPVDDLRHMAALKHAIDPAGRPHPGRFASLRTPIDLQWGSGDTRYKRLARPGRAALIAARCDTAPSGGACVVALVWESEATGVTWLGEVRIPAGQRFGSAAVDAELATLPEGAWVRAQSPAPANGATGVDVSLTVEVG